MRNIITYRMREEHLQQTRENNHIDENNAYLVENDIRPDIVFLGDSITNLWDVKNAFKDFGVVVNNGICGDRAHYMAERFECDVTQLHPGLCVFMGGINNLWGLDAHMHKCDFEAFGDEWFNIVATVRDAWKSIFEQARANNIKLAVCSITPLKGSYRKNIICELNYILRLMANKYGVVYVDYYSEMADENGILLDGITQDELHPNSVGYGIMERILRKALAAL